ncbi:MAG: biopolymer transporter ExbD [Verrucomicrobia bacterium]|nr:biopolymer transporter ExbD [Verrucomicrobiota bacterium]MBS0645133.1 biopolymer transporter ExbD [Verrucomicrobiota bacterium]
MKLKTHLHPTSSLVDLTPLVDVVLLMLIFFIITSDILPFKSLNIDPPVIDLAAPPRTTQVLVIMDAQNVIYVGSKKEIVDLESFQESLQAEIDKFRKMHSDADLAVVLSLDRSVEYGDFLRLFALTQQLGVKIRLMYHEACSTSNV